MLRINYINPTGLFSYGYSSNICFEDGRLVGLIGMNEDTNGSSNGAGKTSLFNALCETLFGDNPTDVSGPSAVNKVWGKGCASRVEFESWDGFKYRVTLCRDWKDSYYEMDNDNQSAYNGTGLYLDRFNGTWQDCRGSGMPETRKKILELVGLSYSRFLSIAYMSHRIGSRFLRGTNKDRIDILAGITGIEDWDSVTIKCREKKKSLDNTLKVTENKISFERGKLEEQQRYFKTIDVDWNTVIDDANNSIMLLQVRMLKSQQALKNLEVSTGKEKIAALTVQCTDLKLQIELLKSYRASISKVVRPYSSFPLSRAVHECEQALSYTKGEYASYAGTNLLTLTECPTCGSSITKAKKAKIEEKISVLDMNLKELQQKLDDAKAAVAADEARIDAEVAKLLEDYNNSLVKVDTEISEKTVVYQGLVKELSELQQNSILVDRQKEAYVREQYEINTEISNLKLRIEAAQNNLNLIEIVKVQIQEKQVEIGNLENSVKDTVGEIDLYNWFILNIPYIKLHKLSTSMSTLSDLINSHLSEMGDTVRVDISAFSEKKTKSAGDFTDVLKSEISVEVKDGSKNIDPRLYSDGEIGKISNAFVRSLRDLALLSGKGCNILLLDEMFSFIDYNNSQRLAESFTLQKQGTTIVTDNSGKAGDLMEFDTIWVARKRNGISTLEVAND